MNICGLNASCALCCQLCMLPTKNNLILTLLALYSIKLCIKTGTICKKSHFTSILQRSKVKTLLFDRKIILFYSNSQASQTCFKRKLQSLITFLMLFIQCSAFVSFPKCNILFLFQNVIFCFNYLPSLAHHLRYFSQVLYCICHVVKKRMKINKKRWGLAHFKKSINKN